MNSKDVGPKPISMNRPKSWNAEVENAYRFQVGGYRDEVEYTAVRGHLVEKWPENGFVKKIIRKDGYFNYFDKNRECPEKDIPKCKLYTY